MHRHRRHLYKRLDCSSHNVEVSAWLASLRTVPCARTTKIARADSRDFKTCCVEERYGDGLANASETATKDLCASLVPGLTISIPAVYVGVMAPVLRCMWARVKSRIQSLKCECVPEGLDPFPAWTGETCNCLKEREDQQTCSECADGAYDPIVIVAREGLVFHSVPAMVNARRHLW